MTGRPDARTLFETGLALMVASATLRVARFDDIVARIRHEPAAPGVPEGEATMIARALDAWDRRLPWKTQCFEKGLAACSVLRRRGKCFTLYYGARGSGDALEAHVWVRSGDHCVTGCENASEFRELARYPLGSGAE